MKNKIQWKSNWRKKWKWREYENEKGKGNENEIYENDKNIYENEKTNEMRIIWKGKNERKKKIMKI